MRNTWVRACALLTLPIAMLGVAATARAHGVWGHVHVTGWAIENLPPGELKDFFADDAVRQAAQFGAAYTDSGYAIEQRKVIPLLGASDDEIARGHEYSEITHWEPFIQAMITWIRENDPPPWTSLESRKRVAFVMGCASHGLQDEIFDSTFLFQVKQHDDREAESADPGTDYLLNEQGYLRFVPAKYAPMDTVREVYLQLGLEVSEAIINKGMDTVGDFYLNPSWRWLFTSIIAGGDGNPNNIPWTKAHYMDPDVPGSIFSEIVPTAAHMQALWKRLHGEFAPNDAVVFAYPSPPRRLRSHDNMVADSWVTLIFGEGVSIASASGSWTDSAGLSVPFTKDGTRWGAEFPRLMRLYPSAPLVPGAWYDAGMLGGATLIGGGTFSEAFSFHFQVACTDNAAECPVLGTIPVASTDGSGPPAALWPVFPVESDDDDGNADDGSDGSEPDAGTGDDGASDDDGGSERDAGTLDGGAPDDGGPDDGSPDDGPAGDGSTQDDGPSDDGASSDDGTSSDDGASGDDSSSSDDGDGFGEPDEPGKGGGSSGCAVSSSNQGTLVGPLVVALGFVVARRRRHRGDAARSGPLRHARHP